MLLFSAFYFVCSLLIFLCCFHLKQTSYLFVIEYGAIVFLCYMVILYIIYTKQIKEMENEEFISTDHTLKYNLPNKSNVEEKNKDEVNEGKMFVERLKANLQKKDTQENAEKLLNMDVESFEEAQHDYPINMNDEDIISEEETIPNEETCEETCEEMIPSEESCYGCKIHNCNNCIECIKGIKRIKNKKNMKREPLPCETSLKYKAACEDNWNGYLNSKTVDSSINQLEDITSKLNNKALPVLRNLSASFGGLPETDETNDDNNNDNEDEPTFLNPYYVQENKDTYIKLGIVNENVKVDENNEEMDVDNIDLMKLNEMNHTVDRINYVLNNIKLYSPEFYKNILEKYSLRSRNASSKS